MAQIEKISLTRMNNGAHFEFVTTVVLVAQKDGAVSGSCGKALGALRKAVQDEDDVLVLSRKSQLTKEIATADKRRDTQYGILSMTARFWRNYPEENKANAAKRVDELLKVYKINTSDQYDKQTGLMANMIQELQGAYADSVRTIDMEAVVNAMKDANEAVRNLLVVRTNQEAGRETGRVKAARKATDKAYNNFVQFVNSNAFIAEHTQYDKFIAFMNAEILRMKQQVLRQRASDPVASASDPIMGMEGDGLINNGD